MTNFKSKITQKLFDYFFLNPSAEHYINDLARILKVDPGNLDRKLKELEKEGIFSSEKRGNQKYYFLNKSYSLLNEIKKLYNLKYGLEKKIAAELKNLKELKSAYIFGSYANGRLEAESDIDLLLIGSHSGLAAKRIAAGWEGEFNREFNIIDLTEEELEKKKKNKDEFIGEIFKNKIIKIV